MNQIAISFPAHRRENNTESQAHLDANRNKFSAKCRFVFDKLMTGYQVTVLDAALDGVASLPRRILDLRQRGVLIGDRWSEGRKVYFMDRSQMAANRLRFSQ